MADQVVKADAAAWELLANTWLYAREPDRALEPLIKAAELSGSGDLYLRLAQLYLGREDWEAARRAVDAGLQRGKVTDRGAAEIMIGIVEYKSNRLELARQAFLRAAAYEKSRDAATRWLEILTREEKEASA
jgi:tetratricopeptide (TPR) repeat protein